MKYKVGDILKGGCHKRKVLGVCGLVYILSEDDNFDAVDMEEGLWTESELKQYDYILDDPEAEKAAKIEKLEAELKELKGDI